MIGLYKATNHLDVLAAVHIIQTSVTNGVMEKYKTTSPVAPWSVASEYSEPVREKPVSVIWG